MSPRPLVATSVLVERDQNARPGYAWIWGLHPDRQRPSAIWFWSKGRPLLFETSPARVSSERHASKMEKTVMEYEGKFIPSFIGNIDLPITAVNVRCQKYPGISEQVDIFVHEKYRGRMLDRHCVQLAVVNAKAKSSVLLRDEDNKWGPLCSPRFDIVHGYHSIYFLLFEFFWCYTALIEPRCPSHMLLICLSKLMNFSLYAEYSSGRAKYSRQ